MNLYNVFIIPFLAHPGSGPGLRGRGDVVERDSEARQTRQESRPIHLRTVKTVLSGKVT